MGSRCEESVVRLQRRRGRERRFCRTIDAATRLRLVLNPRRRSSFSIRGAP